MRRNAWDTLSASTGLKSDRTKNGVSSDRVRPRAAACTSTRFLWSLRATTSVSESSTGRRPCLDTVVRGLHGESGHLGPWQPWGLHAERAMSSALLTGGLEGSR